jgi:hypothetical protein
MGRLNKFSDGLAPDRESGKVKIMISGAKLEICLPMA